MLQNYNKNSDCCKKKLLESNNLDGNCNEVAIGSICNKKTNLAKKVKVQYYDKLDEIQISVVKSQGTAFKPPIREGTSDNGELDQRAKKRIYRAVRLFQRKNEYLSFLTLTFKHNPSPEEARDILAQFIKSLKYIYKKKGQYFGYLWVIEIQPDRCEKTGEIVPHFHLVTPQYIEKELLNNQWNKNVKKWQKNKGFDIVEVYPNIQAAKQTIKGYLVKDEKGKETNLSRYLCKGNGEFPIEGKLYSMDMKTSKEIKAIEKLIKDEKGDIIEEIEESLKNIKIKYCKKIDYIDNPILFSFNGHSVMEVIENKTEKASFENGKDWSFYINK